MNPYQVNPAGAASQPSKGREEKMPGLALIKVTLYTTQDRVTLANAVSTPIMSAAGVDPPQKKLIDHVKWRMEM